MSERDGAPTPADVLRSSRHESLTGTVDTAFPEYADPPGEPLGLAQRWLADAVAHDVREPRSISLATADGRGHVSNRTVAVVELSARGLVFTSHTTSLKARNLAENAWASGIFYWRETSQQMVLSGPVRRLDDGECEELWRARPAALHPMTTASRQSESLADTEALRAEAVRLAVSGVPLPRPDRFAGYLLEPTEVEFWSASADRLHHRLRYERIGRTWLWARLQP
ncbi:phenazine biosynthesis FMN-dependent oxidase PhzG [Streptomyces sp. NPDC059454]|jgi:pyridoxamine 5'-phosphate oxidase|uniref:phenazine biosynthesis FMN-dependent oxidase PhzG n=1 Tax=Streptomyces sp. NPDC059454 TaxID=3346836 RepID=UPI00369641DF